MRRATTKTVASSAASASAADIRSQQGQQFQELFGSPGKRTPPPCLH